MTQKSKINVSIFRNYTIEPIIENIEHQLKSKDILLNKNISGYNNYLSEFKKFIEFSNKKKIDLFILSIFQESFSEKINHLFSEIKLKEQNDIYKKIILDIKEIVHKIRQFSEAPILLTNYPNTLEKKLNLENDDIFDNIEINNWFNKEVSKIVDNFKSTHLVDLKKIAYQFGYNNIFSNQYWYNTMLPFSNLGVVETSKKLSKFFFHFFGKNHKLIILDADNTLWGGILGEEGVNGIKLGDNIPGVYYKNFQSHIKNLKNKGIILALCSKNDLKDINEVFKKNKQMILKKNDFVSIKANWESKNKNINLILDEVNLKPEHVIFFDDSHYEINLIKKTFPKIDSIQLKGHPSLFTNILNEKGNFLSTTISSTDKERTSLYHQENKRKKLVNFSKDEEDYIKSLNMVVTIEKPQANDVERLSQLTNKVNQFNSTSLRLTEANISKNLNKKNSFVFKISSKDIVGDLGIIGFILININKQKVIVENFLLSCRVLGRKIENIILVFISNFCKKFKKNEIEIFLAKNDKNKALQEFLAAENKKKNIKLKKVT